MIDFATICTGFGVLVILFLTNFLLAVTQRRPYYFYYTVYVLLNMFSLAYLSGALEYVIPMFETKMPFLTYLICIEGVIINAFTMSYFNTKSRMPFGHRLLLATTIGFALAAVLRATVPLVGLLTILMLYVHVENSFYSTVSIHLAPVRN